MEIRSTNIETKDFRWSTSLNLGHNANKILKLDGDLKQVTSGTSIHIPCFVIYLCWQDNLRNLLQEIMAGCKADFSLYERNIQM